MKKYLEESASTPLGEVLEVMQDRIVNRTTYFGVPALKNPIDFWVYQEIINEVRPTLIIEIGNNFGGSTLALAHLMDLAWNGRVIGIDIEHDRIYPQVRSHPRITLLEGDACSMIGRVRELVSAEDRVMVIEDSSHTYENTLKVLDAYSCFLRSGDYFIVEDSICHHGLDVGPDPGPYEAIEDFVRENGKFEIDRGRESFLITWNPKGFLRRK